MMAQEEDKEENEKKVESKSTLMVMLGRVSQIHSCVLHSPKLGVELNITKQALFSFSMSEIRDKALHGMFCLSACHTLLGGSWMFD